MPLTTSLQNLYSNKCFIKVWFVAISTYCSSRVPFFTNNALHLQVMVIFLKQHFFFLCGLPVFSTELALQSCFCNHSCIQKFFSCKKYLLQQSIKVLILCITAQIMSMFKAQKEKYNVKPLNQHLSIIYLTVTEKQEGNELSFF